MPAPSATTTSTRRGATWIALQSLGWSFVSASETYKPKMTTISYANQVIEFNLRLADRPGERPVRARIQRRVGPVRISRRRVHHRDPGKPGVELLSHSGARTRPAGTSNPAWPHRGCSGRTVSRVAAATTSRFACHTMHETGCHGCSPYYTSPTMLEALVNTACDEWTSLQFYRFLVGAGTDGTLSWDCTSPNWQDHWTSQGEAYCYNDFLAVMAAIPANVETVSPATVATAWNVNPAVTQAPVPSVAALAPATGSTAGGTTVTITGSGFTGAAHVAFGSVQATSFVVYSSTQITAVTPPGAGTVDVTVTTFRGISLTGAADEFTYSASG